MFSCFTKERVQKELYFQLKNSFKMESELDEKEAGIYSIYSGDNCVYVGQSRNITSRLATHLSGKYSECTKINIYLIEDINLLDNTERYAICKLKPIDNIIANFTEDFSNVNVCYSVEHCLEENAPRIILINGKKEILIKSDMHMDLFYNDNIFDELSKSVIEIYDVKSKRKGS